jgi:hypothetical protein
MAGTNPPMSSAEPYDFEVGANGHDPEGAASPVMVKTQPATDVPLPAPWPEQAHPVESAESLVLPEELPLDPGSPPVVGPDQWLDEPRYWLADYQRVPRPKTRPLSRPVRFRKVSPLKSAIKLLLALALIVVLTIGLALAVNAGVQAGTTFFQQLTTPSKPLVTPTTTPAPTLAPTATPKPKKKR